MSGDWLGTSPRLQRIAGLVRKSLLSFLVLMLANGWATPHAAAAEVNLRISSRETYVGVPITVKIEIVNAEEHEQPRFPQLPQIDVHPGAPQHSSQTSFINGVTTRTSTVTYVYRLTPRKAGAFTIPAIDVLADGQNYRTQPVEVLVLESETETVVGDLLLVEVVGRRESLYVGEPLKLTLQIWLRPYSDRRFRYKFDEGNMWSRIDLQNSQWGEFSEALQDLLSRRRRPGGQERLREDPDGQRRAYFVYEIEQTVWPQRPGKLDVSHINIVVSYPLELQRNRGIFSSGDLGISRAKPLAAQPESPPIEIKPIPTAGRPAYYVGAVGQYEISTAATPTEVAVGEPITLTLTITGNGQLEVLEPPPLPQLDELTRDFRVPSDPLAGEVRGRGKVFTQSIRARTDAVTAIPPIPLAYFDPRREEFVTVRSAAIPLTVRPAQKLALSQIVDAGSAQRVASSLTEVSGGILANYTGTSELLSQQAFSPGWPSGLALGLPPVALIVSWLVQRRRHRLRTDRAFARRRAARRVAQRVIRAAVRDGQPTLSAAVAGALSGYVADRCDLPAGGLTRADVADHLKQRRVSSALIDELDHLLRRCETLQYAAPADQAADDLAELAARCITRLEKERF